MAQARIAIHKQLGSILQCSGIYRSKSWGYQSSHEFLNQAIEIQTRYTAQQCLNILKQIESALGRFPKKTNLYEDRCIDLDLLYFNNDVILLPNLNIPHPQISKRAFVLKPLTDLIPEFKDPLTKLRVKTMLQKNKGKDQISLYSNGSPKLISIMGPIGSGKTTLAKALVKNLNARFIQERYTKNTNLHLFYKGNTSKAFAMETWFLNEHKKQFDRKRFKKPNQLSISDYYLSQNYLFAKQNLSAKDFKLFEKKYYRTAQACMFPDYIIYLTCSASKSQQRIQQRNQKSDGNIRKAYLNKMSLAWKVHMAKFGKEPGVCCINTEGLNIKSTEQTVNKILELIERDLNYSFRPEAKR